MKNEPVTADKITMESTMNYKGTPVLHYRIEYPRFHGSDCQPALDYINEWYRKLALDLQKRYETELYREAAELYDYTVQNQFPFHMYEAVFTYEIPYNQDGVISLYHDQYLYTGGAHGGTERRSETWDVNTGYRITLLQFAKDPAGMRADILNNIRMQIAAQLEKGESMYFDDYPQLIAESFNPESFYLTPQGTVIYYQQYEIAPYASGIPEFTITF